MTKKEKIAEYLKGRGWVAVRPMAAHLAPPHIKWPAEYADESLRAMFADGQIEKDIDVAGRRIVRLKEG